PVLSVEVCSVQLSCHVDFLGNLGVESEGLYVSDTRVSSSVKALTRLHDFAGLQEQNVSFGTGDYTSCFFILPTVLNDSKKAERKQMNRISRALLTILFSAVIATAQTKPADEGWPRRFAVGANSAAVYQPQIEEWSGNSLSARAAIAISVAESKQPLYGVLWFTARADIDKVNRLVTLSQFQVQRLSLPMAPDKSLAFETAFQARIDKQVNVIALDRLLADMAINHATTNSTSYDVKNDPPQILFSTRPALLVLVDGAPVFRPVNDTNVERIINTRVLILRAQNKFYLRLMDGWLESQNLNGPWTIAGQTPNDLNKALGAAIA